MAFVHLCVSISTVLMLVPASPQFAAAIEDVPSLTLVTGSEPVTRT
jgi:hypothetical protein